MVAAMLSVAIVQASSAASPAAARTEIDPPELVCTIDDKRLDEASGIVAGRVNPGFFYTHNDSGGKPIVFVLDRDGRVRAEFEIRGAVNIDWEDIAIAPGPDSDTFDICAADIGDNDEKRAEVQVYRFTEPPLTGNRTASQPIRMSMKSTKYSLRYADGPHNAEAFVVHPKSGDGFIITKKLDGSADAYRIPAPWPTDRTIEMKRVGKLTFPETPPINTIVTAADYSYDGSQLVTRSYMCGWLWTMSANDANGDFMTMIRREPVRVELAAEPQGEAVCFSADGRCLLTISEKTPTRLFECCRTAR